MTSQTDVERRMAIRGAGCTTSSVDCAQTLSGTTAYPKERRLSTIHGTDRTGAARLPERAWHGVDGGRVAPPQWAHWWPQCASRRAQWQQRCAIELWTFGWQWRSAPGAATCPPRVEWCWRWPPPLPCPPAARCVRPQSVIRTVHSGVRRSNPGEQTLFFF